MTTTKHEYSGLELTFLVLLLVPLVLWQAYATQLIWSWYLVPIGLPKLTLLSAFGLCAAVRVSTTTGTSSSEKDLWSLYLSSALGVLIGLGILRLILVIFS